MTRKLSRHFRVALPVQWILFAIHDDFYVEGITYTYRDDTHCPTCRRKAHKDDSFDAPVNRYVCYHCSRKFMVAEVRLEPHKRRESDHGA